MTRGTDHEGDLWETDGVGSFWTFYANDEPDLPFRAVGWPLCIMFMEARSGDPTRWLDAPKNWMFV